MAENVCLDYDVQSDPVRAVQEDVRMVAERVAKLDGDGRTCARFVMIDESLDRIRKEHAGMAEELLNAYEQLGLVFDITRMLADAKTEEEIIDLLARRLSETFQQHDTVVAMQSSGGVWNISKLDPSLEPWIIDVAQRTALQRKTIVECPASGVCHVNDDVAHEELMAEPVFAGDAFVCAIILIRQQCSPPFRAVDMMLVESMSAFCGDLIRNHRLVAELRDASVAMVRSLVTAVDQKDEYTSGHSLRVAYYAGLLAREIDLSAQELEWLQWSALLHDVGKIGIRDEVLKKPGKLTREEFEHIKEHPVRSHTIVARVPQFSNSLDGVLHHHERYDGSGYPSGLAGEAIPMQARVIQVADVFDALTSNRSYRAAYDWRGALAVLQDESGNTVDPRLQKIFDKLIRDRLGNEPDAWIEMVKLAGELPHDVQQLSCQSEDSGE